MLPTAYTADSPFTVTLIVSPADSVAAYVVEEVPPFARPTFGIPETCRRFGGWWRSTMAGCSIRSRAGSGMVVPGFGTRTLSYQVLPDRVGRRPFEGVGVADGVRSSITGDRELPRCRAASGGDRDPADNALGAGELTRYAAAWKREELWPAVLIPSPRLRDPGRRLVEGANATRMIRPRVLLLLLGVRAVPGSGAASAALVQRSPAWRCAPWRPGPTGPAMSRSALTPAPGIRAFALEESPGHRRGPGHDARRALAPSGRVIRWGPFYGPDRVEVSYDVAAGIPGFVVSGRASFDGQSVAVHERTESGMGKAAPGSAWMSPYDGAHQFSMDLSGMPPGKGLVLEMSTDLQHWTLVDTFTQGAGAAFAQDVLVLGDAVRFLPGRVPLNWNHRLGSTPGLGNRQSWRVNSLDLKCVRTFASRALASLVFLAVCLSGSTWAGPLDDVYRLGPDSLPQEGVPKGRVIGPLTLPSQVFTNTTRNYWIYVPAQYDPKKPAALMIFRTGMPLSGPRANTGFPTSSTT